MRELERLLVDWVLRLFYRLPLMLVVTTSFDKALAELVLVGALRFLLSQERVALVASTITARRSSLLLL